MLPPVAPLTDAALMLRFQEGETRAFDELYQRHRGPLYRYFRRQTSASLADDLFQETWLRVIHQRERYRPTGPFAAYLYRIAHNVLVDSYRRAGRSAEVAVAEPPEGTDPVEPSHAYAETDLRRRLVHALSALPPEQREAFMLHQEAGLTLDQIAFVVGANRETVKSRLRYAVKRLKQALTDERTAIERST